MVTFTTFRQAFIEIDDIAHIHELPICYVLFTLHKTAVQELELAP